MAKKERKRGTFIHGIAASEHLDSSGERIEVKGVDISSLTKDGVFNFEHESKKPGTIVGKILEAKKILKRSDCENDDHRYFWDKVNMPYIYISGELFDAVGHSGAADVAAMVRYDSLNSGSKDAKQLINFSIEGSRLEKKGANITKCIARKISITMTPCNKVAVGEEQKKDKETKKSAGFSGSGEDFSFIQDLVSKGERESSVRLKKSNWGEMGLGATIKSEKPKKKDKVEKVVIDLKKDKYPKKSKKHRSINKLSKYDSNVRKALAAGGMGGSPSTAVQGTVFRKGDVIDFKTKKKVKPKLYDVSDYHRKMRDKIKRDKKKSGSSLKDKHNQLLRVLDA